MKKFRTRSVRINNQLKKTFKPSAATMSCGSWQDAERVRRGTEGRAGLGSRWCKRETLSLAEETSLIGEIYTSETP